MRFQTEVLSRAGGREPNEDHCGWVSLDRGACWVLADGLGGHGGGSIASEVAVTAALDEFTRDPGCSPEAMLASLENVNRCLHARQEEDARLAQMRTTAVMLISDYTRVLWGHAGDSRLYYFRQGSIALRTRDHSVPQALSDAGKIAAGEIRFHPDRNRLLRALGNQGGAKPEIQWCPEPPTAGDAFLLCSDGFWEYVTEVEMEADYACSGSVPEWLERMEMRLRRKAPEGNDNYSAVGIFVV